MHDVHPLICEAKNYVLKNYLVLVFAAAFILALSWPAAGQVLLIPKLAGVHVVKFISTAIVFLISGLVLDTAEVKAAFTCRSIPGTLYGFIAIVGITPLLGFLIRELPLNPPYFVLGLTILTAVPTTLGVGISLTSAAKGNVGLAVVLTVLTNSVGVFVVPLWLKVLLTKTGVEQLEMDFLPTFVKLLLSSFVPTVVGKLFRSYCPGVLPFVRAHKVPLSLLSNTSLGVLIWVTLSDAREVIVNVPFGNMLLIIATAILMYGLYLAFNSLAVFIMRVPLREAIATIILASQKSAPVAITVIMFITQDSTLQGSLSVPCIFVQLIQIFLGQPLANALAKVVERAEAQREAINQGAVVMEVSDLTDRPAVEPQIKPEGQGALNIA